jgi:hypothetical protein
MTTSSFKRATSLLIGLLLVVSLICVSAAGQGKDKKHGKARGAATMTVSTATGDLPTLDTPYFCNYTINGSEVRFSGVTFNYSRNMPQNGFLGHIHTVLFPQGAILDKDMQVYNPRARNDGIDGKLWSFQNQDGSVVCKEMSVTTDKRTVKFSQCSNTAIQTCNAY